MANHFIVSQRDNVWLYSHRGDNGGPFKTRDDAIAAAIAEATEGGDPATEVIVQDHDMQQGDGLALS